MKRDFTATCYVLHEDKDRVLLIYHKKFQKWLPPGGHVDPNETPDEAACREVLEETGIEVQLISQDNVKVRTPFANSLARPYLVLLEEIPAHKDTPAHQHIDFIYLGTPVGGSELANFTEIDEMRWFTKDEVLALKREQDIFPDTQDTIAHLLTLDLALR